MPKILNPGEFENIVDIVATFPQGARIEDVREHLASPLSRRTLQRRLATLVRERRLRVEGNTSTARYFDNLDPKHTPWMATLVAEDTPEEHVYLVVSLSPAGEAIRDLVRRPLRERPPVGYDPAMLEDYVPNATFYLPEAMRRELGIAGRLAEGNLVAGTYARKLHDRLLIDLSWNSSRLEGNTYSLLETEWLLEAGRTADGRHFKEAQMILNHKAAIEFLLESAPTEGFAEGAIRNIHALLSSNLMRNAAACGRLRTIVVRIGGSAFEPLGMPQAIADCFRLLVEKARAIEDPIEAAFFAMVHIPYLQPFEDVNKRVSRLAANIPLVRAGLCPLSFVDVPQRALVDGTLGVYETKRVELLRDVFAWAYKRSCAQYATVRETLGEPDPFRLRHRLLIQEAVGEVVRGSHDREEATEVAARLALKLDEADRETFELVVANELECLHEGNYARFRLRPSEFAAWKRRWDAE